MLTRAGYFAVGAIDGQINAMTQPDDFYTAFAVFHIHGAFDICAAIIFKSHVGRNWHLTFS